MIGSRDYETKFPHKLSLTDEQVLQRFCKGFVNNRHQLIQNYQKLQKPNSLTQYNQEDFYFHFLKH